MTVIAKTHETGTSGNDVAKSLSDRDPDRNTVGLVPQVRAGHLADTVKSQVVRETDALHRALADQQTESSLFKKTHTRRFQLNQVFRFLKKR